MANKLTLWGVLGFMLAASGAVVAVTSWPETTTEFESTLSGGLEPSVSETGSEAAANFGLVLLGVGSTMLWIVLIAFGVYCGLRMLEERRALRGKRGSAQPPASAATESPKQEAKQRIAAKSAAEETS